jgi:hypothetical protein
VRPCWWPSADPAFHAPPMILIGQLTQLASLDTPYYGPQRKSMTSHTLIGMWKEESPISTSAGGSPQPAAAQLAVDGGGPWRPYPPAVALGQVCAKFRGAARAVRAATAWRVGQRSERTSERACLRAGVLPGSGRQAALQQCSSPKQTRSMA